ncbi:MAG: RNA polymerase subunit sigma-24, partial [Actinobacteria bacterium]|nr:RNA polymerase subunit sigma-24 [Actinomycetota bacterium]
SWRRPIVGREHVGRLLANLGSQMRAVQGSLRTVEVNGQPGALVLASDGSLIAVLSLDIADGQVQTFRSILNRDKLRHLGPLADIPALLEQRRGSGGSRS